MKMSSQSTVVYGVVLYNANSPAFLFPLNRDMVLRLEKIFSLFTALIYSSHGKDKRLRTLRAKSFTFAE